MLSDKVCLDIVGHSDTAFSVQNALNELEKLCPLKTYSGEKELNKYIDQKFNKYTEDPKLIASTKKIEKFHDMANQLNVQSLDDLRIYGYNKTNRMFVPGELERRYKMEKDAKNPNLKMLHKFCFNWGSA